MKKRQPFRKVTVKKGTASRLLKYVFKRYSKYFIIVVILIVISSFVNVTSSIFLQILLDHYIVPLLASDNPNFIPLLRLLVSMSCVYFLGVVASFVYSRVMIIISQGTLKNIRDNMFLHMQRLPIKYFYDHEYGDIMSIYTNDTDALREMIGQSIPQVLSAIVTIVMVLVTMIKTNLYLTCLVLAITLSMFIIIKKITTTGTEHFLEQQETIGKIDGFMEEMLNAQKIVKSFSYERVVKEKFDTLNTRLFEYSSKANGYVNILMPIMGNISNLQYVLIGILGGILAINTNLGITLGSIASFMQLSKTISAPIHQISQQVNSIVVALAGAERIFNLLDSQPENYDGLVNLVNAYINKDNVLVENSERTNIWAWKLKDNNLKQVRGKVEFVNVEFEYSKDIPVLKDFCLYAKPGQKIALIGATGAGKTTIANLLNRFYDVQKGEILYDGINIKDIKKDSLRNSIGMVLQDTNLFTGSIKENIRYGKQNASDECIYNAARLAHAHDFICNLPCGYDTQITNNGQNLSEGQRKLIAITQAIVKNPPVMILDEATSSIDTMTEKLVQKGMDQLMKGRTSFVIAHRLQTIQNADLILVIDHGKILECGRHRDLISNKGVYYNLCRGAFVLE